MDGAIQAYKMPRKANLDARKNKAVNEIIFAMRRYDETDGMDYLVRRWAAQMAAVAIHATWERYVESRLVAALNHNPKHFIKQQSIVGASAIPTGLALYIVRGGKRFFDFRSMSDLVNKADFWLGKDGNPFRSLDVVQCAYIDCLAAIRNYVVHGSETSFEAYKQKLKLVHGIRTAPSPEEFLHAKDYRPTKPIRLPKDLDSDSFEYRSRLSGVATVVIFAVARS